MEEVAAVPIGDDRWKARGAMHSWLCGILRGVKTPDLQQLLRRSTAGAPSRGVRCLEGVKKVVINAGACKTCMRAFGAHESSIRHATSLSEQTERRLRSARRNCRLRGGTAECAEELGKLINSKHGAPAERERSRCEAEAAAGAGPSA